ENFTGNNTMITVKASFTSPKQGKIEFEDKVRLRPVRIYIAMDGDRDGEIDFNDPEDKKYLFWVNNDVDTEYRWFDWGLLRWILAEDDMSSGSPNCNDDIINSKRDLDDFTRVHVQVCDIVSQPPDVTYHFTFKNSEQIQANIFKAVPNSIGREGTLDCLSNVDVADIQIKEKKILTAVSDSEVLLPNEYINSGNRPSCFLLEGKRTGTGYLTFVVKLNGKSIGESRVWLDLREIEHFYEKLVVDHRPGGDGNLVSPNSRSDGPYTYEPEADEYVLHVHGWNMADWEKDRWSETVFKRLWWQGYKGHLGSFQWPTLTGYSSSSYVSSEWRAWRSESALSNRLTVLNSRFPGEVRLIAHSMGNVVAGEAISMSQQGAVKRYIAMQAAIPGHAYDNNLEITEEIRRFRMPNIYGHYYSGILPDQEYFRGNVDKTQHFAYINREDFALDHWETNNRRKPSSGYRYEGNANHYDPDRDPVPDRFVHRTGGGFRGRERILRFHIDRYEIFSQVLQSRSRALGTYDTISGFKEIHDLQGWGFDDAHYSHSRQFRSNIAREWPLWNAVSTDMQITR
ncbi:MAG: hypothetical protein JW808_11140, partial [Victivallales bacterium]|nr:hypothetical protein [Victivallales bacterium]